MFSASTYAALAAQLARLVRSPSARLADRHGPSAGPSADGCGRCPLCGEFVFVEFAAAGEATPCPRYGRPIAALDPLGPS